VARRAPDGRPISERHELTAGQSRVFGPGLRALCQQRRVGHRGKHPRLPRRRAANAPVPPGRTWWPSSPLGQRSPVLTENGREFFNTVKEKPAEMCPLRTSKSPCAGSLVRSPHNSPGGANLTLRWPPWP
jgi:hypothetical protein